MVSANRDTVINNIKNAIKVTDRVSAQKEEKGDSYTCRITIAIPENLKNPNPNRMYNYMVTYQVKVEKGEKDNYIFTRIEEMTPMK